jgi:hypothetical protein
MGLQRGDLLGAHGPEGGLMTQDAGVPTPMTNLKAEVEHPVIEALRLG